MPLINLNIDPVWEMRNLGFSAHQEVSPTYGYSGRFEPSCTFGHWTASARGSDTAALSVRNRHYHCCVNRVGHIVFGGYKVRQAHGGRGRKAPMREARQGQLTAARWEYWNDSGAGDDTAVEPNQYGMSVCIDCTVDENVRRRQYDAWLATQAMWLARSNMDARYAHLHSVSTNRKIDVIFLIVDGVRKDPVDIYNDLTGWVTRIRGAVPTPTPQPEGVDKMYAAVQWPAGDGYYQVKPDGGVITFGKAPFYGSAYGKIGASTATHMACTSNGAGYWVLTSDGGVHAFGNAPFHGSCPGVLNDIQPGLTLAEPATNISPTPDDRGYRISCNDGGLFNFGAARDFGHV